jgi:hypothetical protein
MLGHTCDPNWHSHTCATRERIFHQWVALSVIPGSQKGTVTVFISKGHFDVPSSPSYVDLQPLMPFLRSRAT